MAAAGRGLVGWRAGALLALLALAACSEPRPLADPPDACEAWVGEIGPLLAEQCVGCHAGSEPAGGYDLSTYLGALGPGSDTVPNLIVGSSGSRLLRALQETSGVHAEFASLHTRLEPWVVDCRLRYRSGGLHGAGVLNPADLKQFHGVELAAVGHDLGACATCHGDDFSGGAAQLSCLGCHQEGPGACTTCHSSPPDTGAHLAHAAGSGAAAVGCESCHLVPQAWDSPGHVLQASGQADLPPAEVTFGALARLRPEGSGGAPSYDPTTQGCAGVYCHGATFDDAKATLQAPVWSGRDQATCGSCHGVAPAGHAEGAEASCQTCHPKVAHSPSGASAALIDPTLHVDGALSLGDESGGCVACHGAGDDPAPPRALNGATSPSALGVGAHQSHLWTRLAAPIACGACHLVPEALTSPGHLDGVGPAELFPAAAGVGALARTDNAAPAWDHEAGSCAGVYCHGGGEGLGGDSSAGLIRSPRWTAVGIGEGACGACHGVPPADGLHDLATPMSGCVTCHPRSVDPFGGILYEGAATHHLNGVVDVGP